MITNIIKSHFNYILHYLFYHHLYLFKTYPTKDIYYYSHGLQIHPNTNQKGILITKELIRFIR